MNLLGFYKTHFGNLPKLKLLNSLNSIILNPKNRCLYNTKYYKINL